MTNVATLTYATTPRGMLIHAAMSRPAAPGTHTLTALCQPQWHPFLTRPVPAATPTCSACRAVLTDVDHDAMKVMETGQPGGHHTQHDPDCYLQMFPYPLWYYRDRDPDDWLGAPPSCSRLPGCHWPNAEGGR